MNRDELYMKRCIELAAQGLGAVAPNPMVGCVIVCNDTIVAQGYHRLYGEAHAEVDAIHQLPLSADPKNSTLYVNLEPCSHQGKTPPCADLIVSKQFKKVVIGTTDTNPLVAGKGIEKLKTAGIEVIAGVLSDECRELNKRFFTYHEKKRPYIILKWAQTGDGFISKSPVPDNKSENWITGEESKKLVHLWRSQEQAILVGYNTALTDDPQLTTRLVKGSNPVRIVLDKNLDLPKGLHLFSGEAITVIFNAKKNDMYENIHYKKINFDHLIPELLEQLYLLKISSIIIEGGPKTLDLFIKAKAWDEARVFVNPDKRFVTGIKAPVMALQSEPVKSGTDKLYLERVNFYN
ncbi:MAG: bifunctional diaminohydroxyphosphoribosylaminopyrimidine deaminase/5-amino-6-(5-phosphoribosylamino)uracil reductase RibD [Bacteroidia bacterium]